MAEGTQAHVGHSVGKTLRLGQRTVLTWNRLPKAATETVQVNFLKKGSTSTSNRLEKITFSRFYNSYSCIVVFLLAFKDVSSIAVRGFPGFTTSLAFAINV